MMPRHLVENELAGLSAKEFSRRLRSFPIAVGTCARSEGTVFAQ